MSDTWTLNCQNDSCAKRTRETAEPSCETKQTPPEDFYETNPTPPFALTSPRPKSGLRNELRSALRKLTGEISGTNGRNPSIVSAESVAAVLRGSGPRTPRLGIASRQR